MFQDIGQVIREIQDFQNSPQNQHSWKSWLNLNFPNYLANILKHFVILSTVQSCTVPNINILPNIRISSSSGNLPGPLENMSGIIIVWLSTRWPGSCNRWHDQRATEAVAPLAAGWWTNHGILTRRLWPRATSLSLKPGLYSYSSSQKLNLETWLVSNDMFDGKSEYLFYSWTAFSPQFCIQPFIYFYFG